MTSKIKKLTLLKLSLSSTLIAVCQLGFATAGSTDYGYGEISKSMGGTGVAMPLDSLTPATNPAGIVSDQQADFGLSVFSPRRGYDASNVNPEPFGVAPGTHWSDSNYFFLPDLGYTRPFADQRGAFGISLYGNGGMKNLSYSNDFSGSSIGRGSGVFGGGSAGVNLQQLFLNMALAWKLTPEFSVGASLLPTVQTLSTKGVSVFSPFSASPNDLSNQGTDYSYGLGFKLGALFKPFSFFSAGASYQPEKYP